MPEQPQLIYLEPDDEITSVVRRLRAAESGSVVIVAPGRSRATSSAVALRLLAQVAAEEARTISLVADAPTRAVATKAGIAAFASVAEATSGAVPDDAPAPPSAPIRVVRSASEVAGPGAPAPRSGAGDETMAVRVPPKPAGRGGQPSGRRRRLPRWPWLAALLVIALAAGAALLPGATVHITPATQAVGPNSYQVHLPIAGHDADELRATFPGTATGVRVEAIPATGTVTFFNWNTFNVVVPQGTHVSVAGTTAFVTLQRIVVGKARSATDSGQKSVAVAAVEPGLVGNVAAGAIDTIDDDSVRILLRGFDVNPNRLVANDEPTSGGLETPHSVVQQQDVDTVVAAIQADLVSRRADALAVDPDRLYAGAPSTEVPQIDVPVDLVGTEDQATFELTGTLGFDRPYVMKADLDAAARAALGGDPTAAPEGTAILPDSIEIEPGMATVNGNEMTVAVTVRAAAASAIDAADVIDRIAGKSVAEAEALLAEMGDVVITLWPGWVGDLPRIPFRISVETVAPSDIASPSP